LHALVGSIFRTNGNSVVILRSITAGERQVREPSTKFSFII